jgi:ABC-type glycerol-3-phosphate transport system permease component
MKKGKSVFAFIRYYIIKYLWLFVVMGFALFPFIWLVINSFKPAIEIFTPEPSLKIENPTLDNYKWALGPTGANLIGSLSNSFLTSTITALMTIFFASTCGYALGRMKFKGINLIFILLIVSQMLQGPLIMIPWYKMASFFGIINTKLVLILIYGTSTIPISVWMMSGFYKVIPKDLEEAAMIDGCSPFMAFYKVIFPLGIPGLVSIGLYSFILSWNDYQYALILTSSEKAKTVQIALAELMSFLGKSNWGGILASGVIISLPVIVLFSFIQKFLIEGITKGAIKG